ncbi:MAG TPA: hypothetical protein VK524_22525 [Polyangiaceae bacterium]|nr:hypothetical protein [Polyangiaceae bacterium]
MNTSVGFVAVLLAAASFGFWGCESTDPETTPGEDASVDAPVTPEDGSVGPETSVLKCTQVDAPTSCPNPPVRFEDVRTIFGQRCSQPCHFGALNGPWPLVDYEHIASWQLEIRAALLSCTMPPLDGGVGITADEKLAILNWVLCGAQE